MISVLRQFLRFGLVGILNTAVGLGTIFALMYGLGLGAVLSNLIGYGIGLCVSFVLNSRWTFGAAVTPGTALRFLLAFGLSYLANLGMLLFCMGPPGMHPGLAQLVAMVTYTIVFFVLSRTIVFTSGRPGIAETAK